MAAISISDLRSAGSDLLMDSESFLSDLVDHEIAGVNGGFDITIDDWCGTTKFTRTIPTFPTRFPTRPIDVIPVVVQEAVVF